jgi:GDP-L-fucose synthase
VAFTPIDDLRGLRIWVAGHRGLVGSAIVRRLRDESPAELLTASSSELDLRDPAQTEAFVERQRPDVIFLAAARVGGIHANRSAQADFLYDNLMIGSNVLRAAQRSQVTATVVLGSSCVYPRDAPQPIPESALLTGPLEPTNEGYAIAKIATLELGKMLRRQYGLRVVSLMPSNVYGPGDNFDPLQGHVMAALIRKVATALRDGDDAIEVWGTGAPRREFVFVDDLADAAVFALKRYDDDTHLNVGTGYDTSIADLAGLIADVAGWSGRLDFNPDMPDGTPRKLLDISRLTALGWSAPTGLREGIARTLAWYQDARERSAPQV